MGQSFSCLRRHRRKLFIVAGLIGGIVIANGIFKRRFMQWQKQKAIDYFEQMKKQGHFEATLKTCDSAIPGFLPKIQEILLKNSETDEILQKLRENPPTLQKLKLWNDMKVSVFKQMVTEVYVHCLLVVLMRVQICILGGYVYSDYHKTNPSIGEENQQKYMASIMNFFVVGAKQLTFPIEHAVKHVLKDIQPYESVKLHDFQQMFIDIRYNVSQGCSEVIPNAAQYVVLPDFDSEDGMHSDPIMQRIVNETKDILECNDFNSVMSYNIEHGISIMLDRVSECYMNLSGGSDSFTNPNEVTAPLAKIIPPLYNILKENSPTENGTLINAVLQNESLKTFSANLYEAFSQENV